MDNLKKKLQELSFFLLATIPIIISLFFYYLWIIKELTIIPLIVCILNFFITPIYLVNIIYNQVLNGKVGLLIATLTSIIVNSGSILIQYFNWQASLTNNTEANAESFSLLQLELLVSNLIIMLLVACFLIKYYSNKSKSK